MTVKQRPRQRFDFGALERLIEIRALPDSDGPTHAVALRLNLPLRSVHRLRRRGLTLIEADELATRANYHPWNVWDQWDALVDQMPICRLCGDALPPEPPTQWLPPGSRLTKQEERVHDRHRTAEWRDRLDRYRTQSTTTSEVAI